MKLERVIIKNFGVYDQVHEFKVNTYTSGKRENKNLVIVKGPNGSGKSTFFKSIALGLFGRQALGSRITQKEYDEYLYSRFHKDRLADKQKRQDEASVTLVLDYVESGIKNTIKIEREWSRSGQKVTEHLKVLKNGTPPEVQEIDYQTWLNDLIPPGLMSVLCFDAEDMNALVKAKNDEELKRVIERLLGLHLVEQLGKDLDYYIRKQGGGAKYDNLKEEVIQKQQKIDQIRNELKKIKHIKKELESEEKELNSKLNRLERDLSSEGGDYAARRPLIKERLTQLDEEIEKKETKLRELVTGLLPFALAPVLSDKLSSRLHKELELHRKQITSNFLEDKVDELSNTLSKSSIWKEHDIDKNISGKIIELIQDQLSKTSETDNSENYLVHELAENDVLKLQGWIQEAENSVPELALNLSSDLKTKRKEKHEHEEYLKRAPEDDKLEPIFDKIRESEERLSSVRKEIREKIESISSLEFKLEEVEREEEKIAEKIHTIEKEQQKLSLAQKSQKALEAYQESLAKKQLEEFCYELVECFNRICEKSQLLSQAEIDRETFEVILTDQNGEKITVDDLSMGESQIYGLSLLWALRNISGYELPLLIDTPIARLDKTHRSNFINVFLPDISEQVILFATNVEMEEQITEELEPNTAQYYELSFDEKEGSTIVAGSGYTKNPQFITEVKAS